jgi:hypothetical protein
VSWRSCVPSASIVKIAALCGPRARRNAIRPFLPGNVAFPGCAATRTIEVAAITAARLAKRLMASPPLARCDPLKPFIGVTSVPPMSTDAQSVAPPSGLGWASMCSAKVDRYNGRHVGEPTERVLMPAGDTECVAR